MKQSFCLQGMHLQDAVSAADSLGREVGHAHSLCKAQPGAIAQALHKCIVEGAVGENAWPVLHVEACLLYAQPVQARSETQGIMKCLDNNFRTPYISVLIKFM